MKILIYSPYFLPNIGGLENTISCVAAYYQANDNEVKIVTLTPCEVELNLPYEVIRFPNPLKLLRLFRWCDVVHQPNVSLKGIWPFLLIWRPYFVSHHTTNYAIDGSISFLGKLKYFVSRFAINASCSNYVNDLLPKKGVVINSPYNEEQFCVLDGVSKNRDLVFLGRLVSDKGCELIIKALIRLKEEGSIVTLTVVGKGPELSKLKELVVKNDLFAQVNFTGPVVGVDLTKLLNSHQILIAPSIHEEPFGKIALEGLACGCKVIVSKSGGLPEAAGKTGFIFKKNDVEDLKDKIKEALNKLSTDQEALEITRHLEEHQVKYIGKKYLNWISKTKGNDV